MHPQHLYVLAHERRDELHDLRQRNSHSPPRPARWRRIVGVSLMRLGERVLDLANEQPAHRPYAP
jgi:hypothetical protein